MGNFHCFKLYKWYKTAEFLVSFTNFIYHLLWRVDFTKSDCFCEILYKFPVLPR